MFRRKNHAQHHLSGSVSFPERCGARTNACSADCRIDSGLKPI
jgi:hypothetical protein